MARVYFDKIITLHRKFRQKATIEQKVSYSQKSQRTLFYWKFLYLITNAGSGRFPKTQDDIIPMECDVYVSISLTEIWLQSAESSNSNYL